jgi:uncharacterized protein RhaS with RHS repeats
MRIKNIVGQRYYDPKTGRWSSSDPAGNIDRPNLYTFARNNPMTYVDYFGLSSEAKSFWDIFMENMSLITIANNTVLVKEVVTLGVHWVG